MLIFTATTVAEAVLLAGMVGIFVQFYKTRARQQVRQKFRKVRQTSVRTVALEQQARQHAAELIESPDKLADDYKVEVALPVKSDSDGEKKDEERRPSKAFPKPEIAEAEPGIVGEAATEDAAQKEAPAEAEVVPMAERKGVGSQLRSLALLALLPLLPLLAWPILSKFVTVWKLVMIFLRVGTVTFGGGFVMIPQIETDVVDVHRWMNHQTFADGMAFGQITPGPVLITATFIGYKVAGPLGSVAATIAAFLPSFIMTVLAGASLNRFRTNFLVQSFLAGVAPAVVGMLAAAGVSLAKSGLGSPLSYGVATLAFL
jgi:chromate transport protein ChrA